MAEILDLDGCELLSLEEAMRTRDVARTRVFGGGQAIQHPPLLWPSTAEIEAHHNQEAVAADVDVYVVRDAVVGGTGGHRMKAGRYVTGRAVDPSYVRHWMEHDLSPEHWAFTPKRPVRIPLAIAVLNYNYVYGHFLTEVMPKLFLVRHLARAGVRAPLVAPSTAPAFVREIIAALLPGYPVLTYDPLLEQVEADLLVLPGMMGEDHFLHPQLDREIDALTARFGRMRRVFGRTGERAIFVSRRKLDSAGFARTLLNLDEVEAAAAELGVRSVAPETLPWRKQVALFSNARLIIGEFGSGMHNAMFAPSGAHVICLNWIVWVQSRIANLRGQRIGYQLDPDGQPRRFSLDGAAETYRIDVADFRRHVLESLQALDSRRATK